MAVSSLNQKALVFFETWFLTLTAKALGWCATHRQTHTWDGFILLPERAGDVRRLDLEFDAKEKLFLFKTGLSQTIRYKGFLCCTKVLVTLFEMKVSEKSGTKKFMLPSTPDISPELTPLKTCLQHVIPYEKKKRSKKQNCISKRDSYVQPCW